MINNPQIPGAEAASSADTQRETSTPAPQPPAPAGTVEPTGFETQTVLPAGETDEDHRLRMEGMFLQARTLTADNKFVEAKAICLQIQTQARDPQLVDRAVMVIDSLEQCISTTPDNEPLVPATEVASPTVEPAPEIPPTEVPQNETPAMGDGDGTSGAVAVEHGSGDGAVGSDPTSSAVSGETVFSGTGDAGAGDAAVSPDAVPPPAPRSTRRNKKQTKHGMTRVPGSGFQGLEHLRGRLPSGEVTQERLNALTSVITEASKDSKSGLKVIRTIGTQRPIQVLTEKPIHLMSVENMVLPSLALMVIKRNPRGQIRPERTFAPRGNARASAERTGTVISKENYALPETVVGANMLPAPYLYPREEWRCLAVLRAPYGLWSLEMNLDGSQPDIRRSYLPKFHRSHGLGAQGALWAFITGVPSIKALKTSPVDYSGGTVDFGGPREICGLPQSVWTHLSAAAVKEQGAMVKEGIPACIIEACLACLLDALELGGYNPRLPEEARNFDPDPTVRQLMLEDFTDRTRAYPMPAEPEACANFVQRYLSQD